MSVRGAQHRIREVVSGWQDVTEAPHRFGGVEFRLGKRELGHIHGDWLVDIPFPKQVRDEVITAGEADPQHILPDAGWVSVFLQRDDDVEPALALLRRSFSLAVDHKKRVIALRVPEAAADDDRELRISRSTCSRVAPSNNAAKVPLSRPQRSRDGKRANTFFKSQ